MRELGEERLGTAGSLPERVRRVLSFSVIPAGRKRIASRIGEVRQE
jgi:hypothetical protein